MKERNNLLKLCFIMIATLLLSAHSSFAFEDAIIAVVDEEVITLKDLKDYNQSVYTQLKLEGKYSDDEIQKIMQSVKKDGINRLIDDRLVLSAANKEGIETKRSAIDEKINAIKDRYPSEKDFTAALILDGLTVSDLRKQFSDQLKAQYFIDIRIKSPIQVNPQEVTDFYHNNKSDFKRPERVKFDSIFIPSGKNPENTHQKINEAYAALKAGKSFNDTAKSISISPSSGELSRGQMKPEIEKQIFDLNENDFTAPIESDEGYFLFKLTKHIPEEIVSLEKAKDQIVQFLLNKKFKNNLREWLNKTREETYIEIKNH